MSQLWLHITIKSTKLARDTCKQRHLNWKSTVSFEAMLLFALFYASFYSAHCLITANCVITWTTMTGSCIRAVASSSRTWVSVFNNIWVSAVTQWGRTTPFSQMTDILSSTPFTPLGILVKSSLPRAFWHTEKVQLSVPVTLRSSLAHLNG